MESRVSQPTESDKGASLATALPTDASATGATDVSLEGQDGDPLHKSTLADVRAMERMGRQQELVRHFRPLTMVSFVGLSTLAWEGLIYALSQVLVDGGRPTAIYSMIWSFVAFIPIYLSLAEMSSMAPIAGAQYHWVSEFAPERFQKILSYGTGWVSTLAWQAGNAGAIIGVGFLCQAFIAVNVPDYAADRWHATVISVVFTVIALGANIIGSKLLPHWQNAVFLLHIIAFFIVLIPAWTNAPSATHRQVWLDFENTGGWSSQALAIFVGQMPSVYAHLGVDSASHMAEEVRDAPKIVPRVIIIAFLINMVFNFLTVLTICYHVPDIEEALNDITGYPGLYMIRQSMSLKWLNVVFAIMLILQVFGILAYLAAVSRDLYAFARDQGFPYSRWIAKVDKRRHIPTNAYIVTGIISAALSLIYIGSPTAFNALLSLYTVALLQCYLFSVGCILWRRVYYPETLPPAAFSLGRWGIPINASAFLFILWSFFWAFWPGSTPVDASSFNWASVVFAATVIVAAMYYVCGGSKKYHGPVTLVQGRKAQ